MDAYRAYRRDGGESTSHLKHFYTEVLQAIRKGTTADASAILAQLAERSEFPADWTALIRKLNSVVRGERNLSVITDDIALDYRDAVDLQLLLEQLAGEENA